MHDNVRSEMSRRSPIDGRARVVAWGLAPATAIALVLSVTFAYSGVRDAARTVAQGDAQRALGTYAERLAALRGRPSAAELDAIRAELEGSGVTWLGLVDPSGEVSSGEPIRGVAEPLPRPGELEMRDGVVRAAMLIAPPRGRRPPPPPLPPRAGPRRGPPVLLVELRPPTVVALEQRASLSLMIGIPAALLVMLLALAWHRVAEQRAHAVEDAERAKHLSSLGTMSAVLAHEIRNPLASLKGHAQLLEEMLAAGTRERAKVERIVREAERLERLTSDLLAFVRSGSVSPRELDVGEWLARVVEPLGPRVRAVRGPPLRAAIDPERMEQVILNLVQNALAADASGEITVRAELERGALRIEVRDHGPGIAPGDEERIFEPFHTTKVHGTGLGLAFARRVVEAHGGTLRAHNASDGGAVLELRVPPPRVADERQ